jgi:hypothetical protein
MISPLRLLAPLICVLLTMTTITAAQQPKPLNTLTGTPTVYGFNVALVLGDLQGASKPDNLAEGAKKALADMRDFLPYKSYRLLDTQWILCCGSTKAGSGVSGRLRGMSQALGPEEQEYPFNVTLVGVSGSQLSIRFFMTNGGYDVPKKTAPKPPTELSDKDLQREKETKEMRRQVDELLRPVGGFKGAIIDSTFSMDVGETVVIGTSSLKGDKALIALLTAAKRPTQQTSALGEKR